MGSSLSALVRSLFKTKPVSVVMVGLDGVGKTTVLYKMKTGETAVTVPTIGFNVEQVTSHNLTMTIWDMGGQDKIRHLWRHYFTNTDALILVLDSSDTDRIDLVRDTLQGLMREPLLEKVPIMILANKQDLPQALPPGVIADKLGLYQCRRVWYVQPACALSGEGLDSMLRWLASALRV
mmetsp:Transcript_13597/g.25670  ORF Transcript_13597/g.25670 Transcript_13597/m.25670 type:complete len:179 (+) Transcript_13597:276-812(+)